MQLFNRQTGPVFLKSDSSLETDLIRLKELKVTAPAEMQDLLSKEIAIIEAGIAGEKNIAYELKQASYPMAVLHDLYLEQDGETAQIDYLIVTRGCTFVIESKNLIGEITVDNKGEFTRKIQIGNRYFREGIYSPVTQNTRHIELLKKIVVSRQKSLMTRMLASSGFSEYYKSLVVFANAKSAVNDRYAPKEIKQQLIKADRLVSCMHGINMQLPPAAISSEKEMMNLAESILKLNQKNPVDYLSRFEKEIEEYMNKQPVCPVCGSVMVKRIARKGSSAGKAFYGCSRYPECRGTIKID